MSIKTHFREANIIVVARVSSVKVRDLRKIEGIAISCPRSLQQRLTGALVSFLFRLTLVAQFTRGRFRGLFVEIRRGPVGTIPTKMPGVVPISSSVSHYVGIEG